jgi:hypothetical protein
MIILTNHLAYYLIPNLINLVIRKTAFAGLRKIMENAQEPHNNFHFAPL